MKTIPQNSLMQGILKEFHVEQSVHLNDVVNTAVYSAFDKETDGKRYLNKDMEQYSLQVASK